MALFMNLFASGKIQQTAKNCGQFVRVNTLPMAKHPGFTASLASIILKVLKESISVMQAWRLKRKNRATVRSMFDLEDAILDDMSLTRGDLHYVLHNGSSIDPTTQLKLLSLQRRTQSQADLRRRSEYYASLMPSAYENIRKGKPRATKATV